MKQNGLTRKHHAPAILAEAFVAGVCLDRFVVHADEPASWMFGSVGILCSMIALAHGRHVYRLLAMIR